jgi:hypothetical protein
MQDLTVASTLLRPYDARVVPRYPISSRISQVANDDEGCLQPIELPEVQNQLFS